MLGLHVVGHVGEHEVVGGAGVDAVVLGTDRFEFALEVGIRHRAGVLEFAQTLVGEEIEVTIWDDLSEGSLAGIGNAVVVGMKPCEDVGRSIVKFITVEMVRLVGLYFSFRIDIGRTFSVEGISHEDMASIDTLAKTGITAASLMHIL